MSRQGLQERRAEPAAMAGGLDLVSCPECGVPAFVEDRFDLDSTDGQVPHVKIRCINRHLFTMQGAGLGPL